MEIDEQLRSYIRSLAPAESEPLRAARARSEEADIPAVPMEVGVTLRWLAGLLPCRTTVEIGSGGGYSGLWLLDGMGAKGMLTTIEADPSIQDLSQQAYAEAGRAAQVRSILGPALSVLPKLADEGYDMVFLDADKGEYPAYLAHARRLLRPGGLLVADNALWHGRVADPAFTDADTEGVRAFNAEVVEDAAFDAHLLTVGDGLLVAGFQPGRA